MAYGTALGTSIGNANLFYRILKLAAGRPVFNSDNCVKDQSSSNLLNIVDWNNTSHAFTQATSGSQAPMPLNDNAIRGKLTIKLATSQSYASNNPSSFWVFCQNTNTEFYSVIRIDANAFNRVWGTMNQSPANRGWLLAGTNSAGGISSNAWSQYVGNASGTYRGVVENSNGTAGIGTYRQVSSRWVNGTSINVRSASGDVLGTTNGAGDGSNPTVTMQFGNVGGVFSSISTPFFGWFPALTTFERSLIAQYLLQTYGVALI